MMKRTILALAGAAVLAPVAMGDVFPTNAHAFYNRIPFGVGTASGTPTHHQVFASTLFSSVSSGLRVEITSVAFEVNPSRAGTTFSLGEVTINFSYTNALPGQAAPVGLGIPVEGGGGAPNASGPVSLFYTNPATVVVVTSTTPTFGEMAFEGDPFVYDPDLGNLLMEIVVPSPANTAPLDVSRAAGSGESSRAYAGTSLGSTASPSTALRVDFTFTVIAECDPDLTTGAIPGSPGYGVPNGVLNNDDFFYYLSEFAAGNVAVADLTTTAILGQPGYGEPNGILNNDDFFYYLAIFAAGC